MQDRPDLIQSELAGLAFDSLQQVFRKSDVAIMHDTPPLPLEKNTLVWLVVDPAAGGPQSDYAVISVCRIRGTIVVRPSRENVAVFACLHERKSSLAFVSEKSRDDGVAEVHQESRELGVVGLDLYRKYAFLERLLHVEEEEENCEEGVLRGMLY